MKIDIRITARVIFFLFVIFTSNSFAQESPAVNNTANNASEPVNQTQATEKEEKTEAPAAQPPAVEKEAAVEQEAVVKNVTAIEIKGNTSISSNTVISKMKTKVGSPYQDKMINSDIKRLYLLGFFSDIKVDTEAYKEGLKIIITVIERPVIEKIIFSGIRRLSTSDEKLKTSLKSKEGQYLDYPNISEDIRTLKKMYEKKGFGQAEIDFKEDLNKETNKVKLSFNVKEGNRLRIKNIFVQGNKSVKTGRILKLMKTKRAWTFNAGILKEEVLKEDIERVKLFYRKNGFADVEADYEVKPGPKKSLLFVTLKVEEGKKYLVGRVTVKGNKDIPEKDILEKIKEVIPDKVFSQEKVKQDSGNILGLYFDRGYISAQVQEAISMDPITGRVNIEYYIQENEITYVDKIKIKGNIKTRDLVIRRELRIKPGDRFDGEKLRRSKERLQNLGFFEEISYDTEETPVSDKKDLVVEVKEAKTGAFSFGGGYSTVDKFIGFVEIEQKNFDWKNFPYFTGAGQNLKLRASIGSLSSGFDLSFTEPWLFDYPVSFGFDAYKRTHERDTDVGYGYDEDITGGDIRLGKELSEYVRGNLTYRFETIEITNISETATDLQEEYGKNDISSAELGLSYDDRDSVFDATKGNYLSSSWLIAGGPLGGDKDFWKSFIRASHYFPLWAGSVLETKCRVGVADTYGDSFKVPIYERLFAGGAETIRGYRERKIGPIDSSNDPLGGESLLVGNVEYRFPLASVIKLALFYDIGNVWEKSGDIGSGGFKAGAGVGFRIKTPLGPLVLDYGIPLDKEPGEDTKGSGRFHFSMSHNF